MIIDSLTQFASATSIVNSVGTTSIGNQIDTALAGGAEGTNIFLTIMVTTAITAVGAGTIQFALASDTTATISGTSLVEYLTPAFTTSTSATLIPAGTVLFVCALPKENGTYTPNKRFLGLLEIVAGNNITAGAVTAFLSMDGGRWAATPTVFN